MKIKWFRQTFESLTTEYPWVGATLMFFGIFYFLIVLFGIFLVGLGLLAVKAVAPAIAASMIFTFCGVLLETIRKNKGAGNFKGTVIITEKKAHELLKIIFGMDNTSGPIGSGGYRVRQRGVIGRQGKTIIVFFTEYNRVPAKTTPAFISGGAIYFSSIGRVVTQAVVNALTAAKISFKIKPEAKFPYHIKNHIRAHLLKERRKNRFF